MRANPFLYAAAIVAPASAALLIFAATIAPAAPSPSPDPAAARTVTIENYAFQPATIRVAAGTEVVWTQKDDDPHTVTAYDGSFDSKGLGQGDVYKHVFDKPGRYPYHCTAHPFMKGVVIVEGAAKP